MVVTREEYEAEISRLQSNIIKAQEWKEKEHRRLIISPYAKYITTQTKYGNPMCKGGGSACWDHINRDKKLYEEMSGRLSDDISNAKQALWDYQKRIAQEEQDAQVKAVREAIAEQVKIEQERIKAQQLAEQQQVKIIETVEIKNPIAQVQQEVIQPQTNNQNLILPLAVVAGVLLL